MNRLTKNMDTQYDFIGSYDTNIEEFTNNKKLRINVMNKLGQLEDIEEELGIDLLKLFKAFKLGIRTKGDFANTTIFIYSKNLELGYEYYIDKDTHKIINKQELCLYGFDEVLGDKVSPVRIKDYGKMWVLVNEEFDDDK